MSANSISEVLPVSSHPADRRPGTRGSRSLQHIVPALIFLLPGLVLFALFLLGPMLYSLRISFYDWNIVHPERSVWQGLDNYRKALGDPIFQRAVANTLAYTLVTVIGQMLLGLGVAALLNQKFRGRTLFRVAYYLPVLTSWVIVSLLFEYMFSSQTGLINHVLKDMLHLVPANVQWLSNEYLAMIPISLLGIWKGVGWTSVIFLAGLQSVPEHLYEAASVDGAGLWARFRYITLPLLRPTMVYLLVVLVIGGLNAYISFLLITNGGDPLDLTHSVLTLMVKTTFNKLNFGYGAAISYLLTLFVFIISIIQLKLLRKPVEV